MRKNFLLTKFALLLLMLVGVGATAWADVIESNFTDKNCSVGSGELQWTGTNTNSFESSGSARGVQSLKNQTAMVFTSDATQTAALGTITKIVVTASTNGSGRTMSVTVGGSTFGSSIAVQNGSTYANTEYTFEGSATGTIVVSINPSNANSTCWIKKIVVTYGTGGGQSNTYSVTYNANGATSGDVPTDANEYYDTNNTVTVLGITNLAKTGFTFSGWNTKADGTGTSYSAGNTFTIEENITLYAQWTVNTYDVTLPAADTYGTYTMNVSNPVAYDTEVTLTYTPASGYENYEATWSVNGTAISGNKFNMLDENVTVTVAISEVVDYVTLPFNWEGGSKADLNALNGVTVNADNSDYADSHYPYLIKFNGDGKYVIVKTDGQPGKVTMGVKMIGGATSSTITVQGSSDGVTYRDIETLTISGNTNDIVNLESTKDFAATDRYVKLYYTKGSNVGVGPITIAKPTIEPAIIVDTPAEIDATGQNGTIAVTYKYIDFTNAPEIILCDVDGNNTTYSWIDVALDGSNNIQYTVQANTGDASRTAYLKVYGLDSEANDIYSNIVSITQAKPVINTTYSLATTIVPGRHYIITNGEKNKAMGADRGNNRGSVDITVSGNQTVISSDAGVCELLAGFDETTGFYTLYDNEIDAYLCSGSNSSNYLKYQTSPNGNGNWMIEINGEGIAYAKTMGSYTRNVMRFNSSNNPPIFSCYASSSDQNDICFFEKDGDTGSQDFTVEIMSACTDGTKCYGTFSAPFAFTVPSDVTVAEVGITNDALDVQEYAEGAVIPANTGVMISSATAGYKTFTSAKGGISKMGDDNRLFPSVWGVDDADMSAAAPSCLYYRLTMHNGTQIGYWWGADGGAAFSVVANKAYLAVPNGLARMGFAFGSESTGISLTENGEQTDAPVFDLSGRRVNQPTKGLYIVNGKKMVVK